jgi:hypothetical protein
MHSKVTAWLTILSFTCLGVYAQDFIGLPSSAYIDNVSDSAAIDQPNPAVNPLVMNHYLSLLQQSQLAGTEAPPEPFFVKRRASFTYSFARTDSKLADNAKTDAHGITPELYLESERGFSLNFGLGYQHLSKDDNKQTHVDANIYSVSIQPAQEVLGLLDITTMHLTAGIAFNYGRADVTSFQTNRSDSTSDAFAIGPNLAFVYPITTKLTAIAVPAYTMQWKETESGGNSIDTHSGLFTFQGRADYSPCKKATFTVNATWKHDIDQKVFPSQTAVFRDWAEFGGSVRVALTPTAGVRVGYSYEAFRNDFETHKALIRLEMGF